ncbi:hypothetical protein BLOT_006100 [Blomia tropicalis]|nr:hypothetical protein BLOT_006100 [Blomia tropicalis]
MLSCENEHYSIKIISNFKDFRINLTKRNSGDSVLAINKCRGVQSGITIGRINKESIGGTLDKLKPNESPFIGTHRPHY